MRQGAGVETSGRIIDTGARYPLTSQDFFGHRGRRTAPMTKYVYFFGGGRAEGSSVMRNLLGGKGCELAEMTNLGIPVPPGFTVTTQAWAHYNRSGHEWPEELWDQTLENLQRLESAADAGFGDPKRPLLVSVRSGASVSMPGMMETILNLGLNDATVEGLAARSRNERFAWDCIRRFVMMVGNVVLGVRREVFDAELDAAKSRLGVTTDPEVPAAELRKLTDVFKNIVGERTGRAFPQDVKEQLRLAINAVFDSWFAKKAAEYRRIHNVPEEWGTAVTVMAMVFGNLGETSGTGVGFTRDPRTGEPRCSASGRGKGTRQPGPSSPTGTRPRRSTRGDCWRAACPPRRARRSARRSSTRIARSSGRTPTKRSSSSVLRPRRRTWRACTPRRASSPREAAGRRTRPSSRAGWARPAWAEPPGASRASIAADSKAAGGSGAR